MNNIRELMDRAGMQQKELASLCHVSGPTISDWANDKKSPSGKNLMKLCDIFHVKSGVILGYENVPRNFEDIYISGGSAEEESATPDGYDDPEEDIIWRIRDQLRRNPESRILFDASAKVKSENMQAAAAMLKALGKRDE